MKQKLIDFLNVFQGLRKSIIMLLLMIIGVSFRIKGYLSGSEFVDLFRATVISYFGANSVEHFTSMVQDHLASKSAPAVAHVDPEAIAVEEDDSAVDEAGAKNG